ncbi:MAG: NifB/NifX family molybdenum-iron cluster-binding protein [Nitrososphaerota archaeon]
MKEGGEEMRIAIATIGDKGLQDYISPELGHTNTFTIIEIENGKIKNIEVIDNPAKNLEHGRGPIIARILGDKGVSMVISGRIGPGASIMLDQLKIRRLIVKPGRKVEDVLREENLIT